MMTLEADVVRVLNDPALLAINFRAGATRVYGSGYRRIATAIEHGHIHVEPDDGPRGRAHYAYTDEGRWQADHLYLPPHYDFVSPTSLALIVHEATHALQDYHRVAMGVIESECAAYVAQAFYFLVHGTTWADAAQSGRAALGMPAENPDVDPIIAAAHRAASRIKSTASAYEVEPSEMDDLSAAIARNSIYAHRELHTAGFNGF
jgi:hypothetical protein